MIAQFNLQNFRTILFDLAKLTVFHQPRAPGDQGDLLEEADPKTVPLPALRPLYIFFMQSTMVLDTPQLRTLSFVIGLPTLLRPQTVRHLRIGLNEGCVNLAAYEAVDDFRVDWPSSIGGEIDRQLLRLADLHLNENQGFDYVETAAIMNEILEQKRLLKRNDLRVYFLGRLLDGYRKFEDYHFDRDYCGVFC